MICQSERATLAIRLLQSVTFEHSSPICTEANQVCGLFEVGVTTVVRDSDQ